MAAINPSQQKMVPLTFALPTGSFQLFYQSSTVISGLLLFLFPKFPCKLLYTPTLILPAWTGKPQRWRWWKQTGAQGAASSHLDWLKRSGSQLTYLKSPKKSISPISKKTTTKHFGDQKVKNIQFFWYIEIWSTYLIENQILHLFCSIHFFDNIHRLRDNEVFFSFFGIVIKLYVLKVNENL